VDPKTAINMSLGPGKVVMILNSGTVALTGPTTIHLYRGTFGTRKSGLNLRMVVLSDQSLSGTLLYLYLKWCVICLFSWTHEYCCYLLLLLDGSVVLRLDIYIYTVT